jgi:multidrug efflux pump subunit AcrA (membrane-fusion protein)
VKAGDLIAEISAGTIELDMESANRNLSDAQSAYNELFDAPDVADLARARATLEESEATQKLME